MADWGRASGRFCSKAPTGPTRTIHRTVAVVVHDSLDTPADGATVQFVAEFDSAGIAPVVYATTDAVGVAMAVLAQGQWGVHGLGGGSNQKVAGATFTVPGLTRPEIDTILVRITLHPRRSQRAAYFWGPERSMEVRSSAARRRRPSP